MLQSKNVIPLGRPATPSATPPRFVIRCAPGGGWIVEDRLDLVGGIFVSEAAARHYAFEESGGRCDQAVVLLPHPPSAAAVARSN